jgi:hypothetical protein
LRAAAPEARYAPRPVCLRQTSPLAAAARVAMSDGYVGETIRNLKRLATGVTEYLADNDDTFFPRDDVGALKPYVPDIERLEDRCIIVRSPSTRTCTG